MMTKTPASGLTKKNSSGATKNVLIVDDDIEIIEAMKFALRQNGFNVFTAHDGNQGVAFAETHEIDLVVLDMMMPKRSGFLVLERLRQNDGSPIPVIMITANEGNRHREYADLLGVSDYIYKPFTMDRLMESVHRILDSNE